MLFGRLQHTKHLCYYNPDRIKYFADLGADLTSGRADTWMDPILGPRRQKKHTQSYRFPCEYWYGPPGKSQSYPASIPALASHRHRSKVKNYDAICFILANDGLMLFCASRRLWRVYTFAQAYLSLRHCTKISCAASDGDFCSIHPGAKTLVSLHICTGVVTGQCNKYQDLSCEDSDESANLHRLA